MAKTFEVGFTGGHPCSLGDFCSESFWEDPKSWHIWKLSRQLLDEIWGFWESHPKVRTFFFRGVHHHVFCVLRSHQEMEELPTVSLAVTSTCEPCGVQPKDRTWDWDVRNGIAMMLASGIELEQTLHSFPGSNLLWNLQWLSWLSAAMFGGPFGMGGMGGMMGGMGGMGAIQPAGIWHFEEFCTPWCKTLQTRWANGANAGAHGANETSATTCVRGWKIAQIEGVPWWMRRPASVVLRIHRGALASGHALSTIQFAETICAGCLNLCNLFILDVLGHVGSLCVTLRASHAHNMRRFFCMLGAVPWEKCGLAGGGIYFAESPSEARRKAHQHGAMKVAHCSASESHDHLKRQGFDSVKLLGRDSGTEYIVYNWDQVTNIREV